MYLVKPIKLVRLLKIKVSLIMTLSTLLTSFREALKNLKECNLTLNLTR